MKIGILGTGLMGYPMALRLLENNYSVMAYNRTFEKLLPLKKAGIEIFKEPKSLINNADLLILMLTDYGAIKEVLSLDIEDNNLTNKTIISMGNNFPK
jgi:3-hydroxyisobutyrate dehydrogenase